MTYTGRNVFSNIYMVSKGTENIIPNGIRSPDRPARSQSLYRQSYAGLQLFSLYIFVAVSHNEDCCAIKISKLIDLSNAIASPTKAVLRKIDNVMLTKIQPDASVCRNLFTAESLYMFRVSQQSSLGVRKTVTMASGTGHNIGTATSLQRGQVETDYRRLWLQFLVLLMMGAVDTRNM